MPSSATVRLPSNSLNWPLTVAIPMCLTWNSTDECEGSTFQVPVGSAVEAAVDMRGFLSFR